MSRDPEILPCLATWPKADQTCWRNAIAPGIFLSPAGKAHHWAAATQIQVQKGYTRWLAFLRAGKDLDHTCSPGQRISKTRLQDYVTQLTEQGLSSVSLTSRITDLMEAIRVMDPAADLELLRQLTKTLSRRAVPSRNKPARIRAPGEIWDAVLAEMQHIDRSEKEPSLLQASRFSDAMILGFLVWAPIRRKNLAALLLGTHLTLENGCWSCTIPGSETKDKTPLWFCLPRDTDFQWAWEAYLLSYRPLLFRDPSVDPTDLARLRGPLWPSTRGKPRSAHALYYAVTRCSSRLLGAPLYPHLLRDCAATALASERPEYVLAASRILGHSQISTTLQHYEHASMLEAGNRLHDVLDEIAEQTGSSPEPEWRDQP